MISEFMMARSSYGFVLNFGMASSAHGTSASSVEFFPSFTVLYNVHIRKDFSSEFLLYCLVIFAGDVKLCADTFAFFQPCDSYVIDTHLHNDVERGRDKICIKVSFSCRKSRLHW